MAAVLFFLALAAAPAHAYIDPGSGMSFMSGITGYLLALFAMVFGAVAFTVRRWIGWLKGLFRARKHERHPD